MKVVTTVHKAGFDAYAHRWCESMENWPAGVDFVMYAEGFQPYEYMNLTVRRCEDLPRLREFKARYAGYVAPSWEYDIVRFSNKVFAAADAFYDYDGLCVWLDADCVTHKKLPDGYIERLLPANCFMGLFQRAGIHSETGFWLMDGKHPEKKAFFDTWLNWFESDQFKKLSNWHDCTTLDATIKLFVKDGRIKTHNLSGQFTKDMHPMAKAELAKYLDHTKGNRKAKGFSPENKFRAEVTQ